MNIKSNKRRIPDPVYERVGKLGKLFDVPVTKAFLLQDKILMGDFKVKQVRKRKRKRVYEVEFEI